MQGLSQSIKANQYIGRFAPSPTGPLHAGSLATALASWLDARAWSDGNRHGRWLVRIEDIDKQRCSASAAQLILSQLAACHLVPDEPPVWQSQRTALYETAFSQLKAKQAIYPCACSRQDIQRQLQTSGTSLQSQQEPIYLGACRNGLAGRAAKSWRFNTDQLDLGTLNEKNDPSLRPTSQCDELQTDICINGSNVLWTDRRLGAQTQNVSQAVGDFVIRRADQQWAYQLAVIVDDAEQGITHVVRGEDLASNTARQILLQNCLGLDTPSYLHTPLIVDNMGHKLSKQTKALSIDVSNPLKALCNAAVFLGLPHLEPSFDLSIPDALNMWVNAWSRAVKTL
jgi:glutamyl-Q tRNA(Asp) synthetase